MSKCGPPRRGSEAAGGALPGAAVEALCGSRAHRPRHRRKSHRRALQGVPQARATRRTSAQRRGHAAPAGPSPPQRAGPPPLPPLMCIIVCTPCGRPVVAWQALALGSVGLRVGLRERVVPSHI
eukprot:1194453-Prorocentrum_minimum.AAC.6